MRIRIHKNQPVTRRRFRAAIPCAGNLIDGFEDDRCARFTRQLRRPVSGIVIADDEFCLPAVPVKGHGRGFYLAQGFANQPLFVETPG